MSAQSEGADESVAVARALIEAENDADVERAVALFHPDATVNDATGPHVGVDELRQWQIRLAANHFNADIEEPTLSGRTASFRGIVRFDEFRALGIEQLDGEWDIEAEDGRVRRFDFRWTPESGAELQRAIEQVQVGG